MTKYLSVKRASHVGAARQSVTKRWRSIGRASLYLAPAVFCFIVFTYIPFVRALWLSLHITNGIGESVRFNGLGYYARILNVDGSGRSEYVRSLGISVQFVLYVVPPTLILATVLAVLAANKMRGIKLFRTIFTSSVAISAASAGVIWSLMFNPAVGATTWLVRLLQLQSPSLLDNAATALAAVAVMTIWSSLGFSFIIALAGIQTIPKELYDSAAIDGAGGFRVFWAVTLPLMSPTLLFLLIINTIQAFQTFTPFSVLINGEGPEGSTNVFVYATYRSFWLDNRYGFASAMSIVLFGVLIILTLFQYRTLDQRVHYQ